MTIKVWKYVKINSVNPLHLIFSEMNGHVKEINRNKYLVLILANQSEEKINKY